MRRKLATPLFLALALAVGVPAHAQDVDDSDPGLVKISPKKSEGGWSVEDLFEAITAKTGEPILFKGKNANITQSKVNWVGDVVLPEDRLFDWLQAVLSYHGLVLVPVGPDSENAPQQWFAMEQASAQLTARPVYITEDEIMDYADRDGLYVVTSFNLKNISDTSRVRNALSPLLTKTAGIGRLNDIPGTRSLIVGDFAPIVAAMKRLVDYIDVDSEVINPQMEVIHLQYAVARELEPIISQLIAQDGGAGGPRNPRQPAPEEEHEPQIIADDRLDALIVYATLNDRQKIRELIEKLDIPNGNYRQRLRFRPLKHTDAAEMADLLEELISGTGSSRTPGNRRPAAGANNAAGAPGVFGGDSGEDDPVIIADEQSNSLIVHASPTQFEAIDRLIDQLDTARPQVAIETALVELSLTDTLALGVELNNASNDLLVDTDGDGVGDTISDARSYFSSTALGLSTTATTTIDGDEFPTGRVPGISDGLNIGIFKNRRLLGILNAFQTSGQSRILTMPSVVTNDNREATLELRRTTSQQEFSTTDAGTDRNSFEEVEATTTLTISPHISSDNYLRLEIDQQVENFGQRPSPEAPPDRIARNIRTEVTLPDRYTVVLGGLIQEEERTTTRKVPFLGDIPILGFFFRQTQDQSSPQHLFLFVTPRILRHTADFQDVHKLALERKLLAEDLFRSEVRIPSARFQGTESGESAEERLRRLEDSGALDTPRLKAPPTDQERIDQARRNHGDGPTPPQPREPDPGTETEDGAGSDR